MLVTFPYSNAELSHGAGLVFDLNKDTGNLSLADPGFLMNPHSAFISTTGGGKTFNVNELLIQFWARGIQLRQRDIEGDKGRLCQQLRGQRVRIAPHAHNYMNLMEVRRPSLDPTSSWAPTPRSRPTAWPPRSSGRRSCSA